MNNKNAKDKSDGQILSEIAQELRRYLVKNPTAVIVRERALDVQAKSRTIEVLHKVVGVSDLYAWGLGGRIFEEVHPRTVKKLVANNDEAEKDVVAASLAQVVGEREYACDDESDAVAVGIAWMIGNGMLDSLYEQPKKPARKKVTKA